MLKTVYRQASHCKFSPLCNSPDVDFVWLMDQDALDQFHQSIHYKLYHHIKSRRHCGITMEVQGFCSDGDDNIIESGKCKSL